jgi:hypothetical protein
VREPAEVEQRFLRRDRPVVHQPQVAQSVLAQELVGLERIDEPPHQVRDLAVQVPGRVVLEPTAVVLEQQPRRAGLLDLVVDRLPVPRL